MIAETFVWQDELDDVRLRQTSFAKQESVHFAARVDSYKGYKL